MKLSRLFAFCLAASAVPLLANCEDNTNPSFPKVPDNEAGVDADGVVAPPQPAQPHTNRNPQPKVTECERKVPAIPSGVCAVTATGSNGLKVIRGTVLGADEVLHNGEIVIDSQGQIACAACDCAPLVSGALLATVVDCPNGVISPGLINPHEHLSYQNNKPVLHPGLRYENRSDWQGARGHARLEYEGGANSTVQAFGELRFLMSGTTAITGGGGVSGMVRNVDTDADALEGLPAVIANTDVFPLGLPGKNMTSGCDYTNPRTNFFVSQFGNYLPHISEGIDAEAHNEFTCTSQDDKFRLLQKETGVIHAVALTPADAQTIRAQLSKVVWSPRSNVDLYGNTAQAVMLDLAGVAISLGTDWVPSGSMNMLRELRCADSLNQTYFDKHFTDADIWRMATMNGALAVGASHALGALKPGYLADIAIYDGSQHKDFRAVLDAGVEDVALVLRGGRAMYGDDAVVKHAVFATGATATSGCESMGDVCGVNKTVCLDVRTSAKPNLATLRAAGEKYYPLYFCRDQTPADEPSCVPSRPDAVKQSTVYTGLPSDIDKDGDGVDDSDDNCPTIFNPVRPMDQGRQADTDKDGIGDACDECPLDAKQGCDHPSGADIDGDGVPNETDNCPEIANDDQADGDRDGHGDVCDVCSTFNNPGTTPCPFAIATLRNPSAAGHPKTRANVEVEGIVSARVNNKLLYIQTGLTGAPWQGILIAADALAGSTTTGPKLGNKIRVSGIHSTVFDVNQITAAKLTYVDATATTPVTPLKVTAGQVNSAARDAAEPYESLLVQIGSTTAPGGIVILNDNADNQTPRSENSYQLVVTGDLRVTDDLLTRFGTPATCAGQPCPFPATGFTKDTTFTTITGIMGFGFNNRKLFPRVATDFVK